MLDDCRGEKKVDFSTGWLPEVMAFDAGGGVEGIWISGNKEELAIVWNIGGAAFEMVFLSLMLAVWLTQPLRLPARLEGQ